MLWVRRVVLLTFSTIVFAVGAQSPFQLVGTEPPADADLSYLGFSLYSLAGGNPGKGGSRFHEELCLERSVELFMKQI